MRVMNLHNVTKLLLVLTTLTTVSLAAISPAEALSFRSIDGSGNNIANPTWGEADTKMLRLKTPAYEDGLSVPRGGLSSTLPSARAVSNAVCSQSGSVPNAVNASDWIWQWGQFISHDMDLTQVVDPAEPFNILVPQGDPFFDPFNTGTQEIEYNRSDFRDDGNNVRQQINQISSYIDGSNVYGSDLTRAADLRAAPSGGSGLLRTSTGTTAEILLPLNDNLLPNANDAGFSPEDELFIAGDVRANEQIGLTAIHTLFVREHNRLATELGQRLDAGDQDIVDLFNGFTIFPSLSGNELRDAFLYEAARVVVGAKIQKITYEEYLPLLLGIDLVSTFQGYDDTVNASVSNEFATAAFRVDATLISPDLQLIDNTGAQSSVAFQDAFYDPDFAKQNGIDSLLLGLASQEAQEIDTFIVDDVRNFLFDLPPGAGGSDLASRILQGGRDHGLPSYNDTRREWGLNAVSSFLDLAGGDVALADRFDAAYDDVEDIDLWIAGLAESHVSGGTVGETFSEILADQFTRLRDGDRFFYLNNDRLDDLRVLDPNFDDTTLSEVIRQNSSITTIQDNAFVVPSTDPCDGAQPTDGCRVDGVPNQLCQADDSGQTVVGTSGADVVFGGLGDDRLRGLGGDDLLCGFAGNDILVGGSGVDRLFGHAGEDKLQGQADGDFLFGGPDSDILAGGGADDELNGEGGDDLLQGNAGNDTLNGGEDNDELRGGGGDDTLDGEAGTNDLNGGPGQDTCSNGTLANCELP